MTNIYWEENDRSGEWKKMDSKPLPMNTISHPTLKEVVGGYDITGGNGEENSISFNFVKKPNWFHRTCCRFFLGWKWNDKKENKKKQMLFG
jgi:hypothetical protein